MYSFQNSFFFSLSLVGTAPFTPFLTSIAKQRGYSASLVGVMFSVMPIVAVLSRPIIGVVTDRYRCQRKTVVWLIVVTLLITASYNFLPESPENVDDGQDIATTLATYQFWLFFTFLLTRNVALNSVATLTDTITLQNLGKRAFFNINY